MSFFQPIGTLSNLLKEGSRHYTGVEESIVRNIEAIKEISNISRTSLGPHGMNKFIINQLDKLIMTKDTAIMLRELNVHHPAANIVANASKTQDKEMGDNTNYVLTIAGEFLSLAEDLIKSGLHPSDILVGYEDAWKKTQEMMKNVETYEATDYTNPEEVTKLIKPVIGTKMLHGQVNHLASLISKSCISVLPSKAENFNPENVRVAKILGGNILDSVVLKGLVVTRLVEGSITHTENCNVAVYNCPFETQSSETKDTVLFKSAEELVKYTRSEEDHIEAMIKNVVDAGVKAVVIGGSVSDLAIHYFDKYKILVFRVMSKFELRRIAKAVGATLLVRIGAPTKEEMGFADKIFVSEISSTKCIIVERNSEDNMLSSIVVRGSTTNILDNMEKVIEDGINAFKCLCKSKTYVPGAGAFEMNISSQIKEYAKTVSGIESYAIAKFGESFEIIPRTIAENAGCNINDVMSKLYSENSKDSKSGLNIFTGEVENAFLLGVYDHLDTKKWAIKFAVDAVLTVLRVDQIIVSKPSGGPTFQKPPGMTNEQDEF